MPERPNILWIQCDEIRVDALSCYPGNPWLKPETPNVQRLAEESVVFENMFCPSPVCMPRRGCEVTSQHATTLGVYHNTTQRHRGSVRIRSPARGPGLPTQDLHPLRGGPPRPDR